MPKVKKTPKNPYGLTNKQQLMITDIAESVQKGNGFKPVESAKKFYNVKDYNNANSVATYNMKSEDFRNALMAELHKKNIIGENGLVNTKLIEGLDATKLTKYGDSVDYGVRLDYIKEINKVIGAYAPEKKDIRQLSIKTDMSEDALNDKIDKLMKELEGH